MRQVIEWNGPHIIDWLISMVTWIIWRKRTLIFARSKPSVIPSKAVPLKYYTFLINIKILILINIKLIIYDTNKDLKIMNVIGSKDQ